MGVLYPSVTTFLQDKLLFLIVRTIMGNLGADDLALPEITVIFLYVVAYFFMQCIMSSLNLVSGNEGRGGCNRVHRSGQQPQHGSVLC